VTRVVHLPNGKVLGINGTIVVFWDSMNSPAIEGVPASGPPAVTVFTVTGGAPKPRFVEFYGYAHENVTRVVLELPDGRRYGADLRRLAGQRPAALGLPGASQCRLLLAPERLGGV